MNKKPWILFVIFILLVIQFFYVLFKYEIIESDKIFWWVIFYFLPIYMVISFFINNKLTKLLFYSTEKYQPSNLTKKDRLKNWLACFGLSLLMMNFFTYNTIILTNDWLGSGSHELIQSKVLNVEYSNTRRARSTGSGNPTWTITINCHGKMIKLTTHQPWGKGDKFEMYLNTGGFWGIKFVG